MLQKNAAKKMPHFLRFEGTRTLASSASAAAADARGVVSAEEDVFAAARGCR
jgi:hypothetical protein